MKKQPTKSKPVVEKPKSKVLTLHLSEELYRQVEALATAKYDGNCQLTIRVLLKQALTTPTD